MLSLVTSAYVSQSSLPRFVSLSHVTRHSRVCLSQSSLPRLSLSQSSRPRVTISIHGARPVHLIITMTKWILSIVGLSRSSLTRGSFSIVGQVDGDAVSRGSASSSRGLPGRTRQNISICQKLGKGRSDSWMQKQNWKTDRSSQTDRQSEAVTELKLVRSWDSLSRGSASSSGGLPGRTRQTVSIFCITQL